MKKTDLDSPENVPLLPDKPRIKGQRYIRYPCPFCESNDKFEILEVVLVPKIGIGRDGHPGQYRCKCTACEYETVITSKTPYI